MKNLLLFFASILCIITFNLNNCWGQMPKTEQRFNPYAKENYPKNEKEWAVYVRKALDPYINDSLVTELFKQADLVFEGMLIQTTRTVKYGERIYHVEPYKVFKGSIAKDSTVKIIANMKPENSPYDIGEWSHSYRELGIFFVKKQTDGQLGYKFLNPKKSWLLYGSRLLNPIRQEKHLKEVLYNRILALSGAKYEKTSFYDKKKENLDTKNAKSESSTASITAFSRDTVPAGVLSGLSRLTIYGTGLGNTKNLIFLSDANEGGDSIFPLHPT